MAQEVGIRELLEAGVHFGHQTRRWNPKMRRFIYGERGGIYIIDLLRTEQLLGQAQRFADGLARRGGTVLFVGTKKQARDGIKEIAEAAGQPYVNHRWLGGLLTNFQTISLRIKRLHDLERYESEGQLGLLPTRERMSAQADLEKLRANLGGVKNMQRVPDALFVIDLKTEAIAVREAQRLRIPIIGLVDTNCDPDGIDYVIPGNDDAIRACNIITRAIGDVIADRQPHLPRGGGAGAPGGRRAGPPRGRGEGASRGRGAGAQGGRGGRCRRRAHADRGRDRATPPRRRSPRPSRTSGAPQAEGTGAAEAAAAAQAAGEPAMPAGGPGEHATAREHVHPHAVEHEREPAGGAGPASPPAAEAEAPAEPEAAAEAAPVAEAEAPAAEAAPAAEPEAPPPRRRGRGAAAEAAPKAEAPAGEAAPAAEPETAAAEAAAGAGARGRGARRGGRAGG